MYVCIHTYQIYNRSLRGEAVGGVAFSGCRLQGSGLNMDFDSSKMFDFNQNFYMVA